MLTTPAAGEAPVDLPGQVSIVDISGDGPASSLPPSELAAFRLIASGLSYKEAAHELGKSVSTIREQMRRVHRRLGVESTIQAMNACGWGPR